MLEKLFSTEKKLPPAQAMGKLRYVFVSPDNVEYERGPLWYIAMGGAALGISALALLFGGLLLTLAFVVFLGVYVLLHQEEPRYYEVAIREHGVAMDDEFFRFQDIEYYRLVWQPPFVGEFSVKPVGALTPLKSSHLFYADPDELRVAIGTRMIEEEGAKEQTMDAFLRILRL